MANLRQWRSLSPALEDPEADRRSGSARMTAFDPLRTFTRRGTHWRVRRLVVIGVLFATACSSRASDRPDSAVLDRLESALRSNPCIAPLARWSRSYGFERDSKSHSVDRRSVTFLYQEAGKFEFKEG